ncbi:hypothetical protein D3C77_421420 [compost metagenome]
MRGQHDEIGFFMQLRQAFDKHDAVHVGHGQIADNQVVALVFQQGQRLNTVRGALDLGTEVCAQLLRYVFALEHMIFDQQHSGRLRSG